MNRTLMVVSLVAVAVAARAQGLGPSVGMYFPTSSKIRNALGTSWFTFGFFPSGMKSYGEWKTAPSVNFLSRSANGNRLLMIPIQYGISKSFGSDYSSTRPYVAFRGGPAYADYAITTGGVRSASRRLVWSASVDAGVMISDKLKLSFGYTAFSKFEGYDVSGWRIGASYTLARF